MLRVGIITMHKVQNFGSALQAYALQYVINRMGYESELIDYTYPNMEHCAYQNTIVDFRAVGISKMLRIIGSKIIRRLKKQPVNLFCKFYESYFHCSEHAYNTILELKQNPPSYDIYMTGSDQVWNPTYIGFDTNYLLDFAPPSSKKVSYAASFATSDIPNPFNCIYSSKLKEYNHISVREDAGRNLIKRMTERDAEVVCDPTLLLNKEEWGNIAKRSIFQTSKQYLLVYIVGYAYNPYPQIYNYIKRVNDKLNLPIIFINTKIGPLKGKYKVINVPNIGPNEFLYLIQNASFIITDSFHGTAFALNFNRRFISCVKSKNGGDSRIIDLLKNVGAEKRAMAYDKHDEIPYDNLTNDNTLLLELYRNKSIRYLNDILVN